MKYFKVILFPQLTSKQNKHRKAYCLGQGQKIQSKLPLVSFAKQIYAYGQHITAGKQVIKFCRMILVIIVIVGLFDKIRENFT